MYACKENAFQKLNWLKQHGWMPVGYKTGKVVVKGAPYPNPMSINDAVRLEERAEALWKRNQKPLSMKP